MSFPLVVSYYTPEYECEIEGFCASLEKWGMEYELKPIENLGSWRKNVGYKPKFITEQLVKHNRPILFIDVDAFVEGPCEVLVDIEDHYDFAARFALQPNVKNRPGDINPNKHRRLKTSMTGTLWFNTTESSMQLLRQWTVNEKGQYLLGQLVLAETWHHERPGLLRTLQLPDEYCWWKGVQHNGPIQIRHTRGAKRHRTEAGKFEEFQRDTDAFRRRIGMRWKP